MELRFIAVLDMIEITCVPETKQRVLVERGCASTCARCDVQVELAADSDCTNSNFADRSVQCKCCQAMRWFADWRSHACGTHDRPTWRGHATIGQPS